MSLRSRLILVFLVVIVGISFIIAVAANRVIDARFNALSATTGTLIAQRIAPLVQNYYAANGSFEGMNFLILEARGGGAKVENPTVPSDRLPEFRPNPDVFTDAEKKQWDWRIAASEERLILVDLNGDVVVDTHPDEPEIPDIANYLEKGLQIRVRGELVGTLIPASAIGALTTVQNQFLRQVNVTIIGVTILGALIAIIIASLLAQRMVAPIQSLAIASQKVAAGDYDQQVEASGANEIIEMANSFNLMAMELENQRDLRHRSMADLAHELRTPLSVLQIELESIEDGLSEPTPEVVTGLQAEVTHLKHLVDDLRTLSLMDAGELGMNFTEVELTEFVRGVATRFGGAAAEKDIQLITSVEPSSLIVHADDHRLAQVLINLLSNAIRHTNNGGTVTVSLREDKSDAIITVRDTGEGISEEHLPHLFERLYRAENARDRRSGGSGLGLSIARSLVEAHGGQIWVKSQAGQGALFGFSIPIEKR